MNALLTQYLCMLHHFVEKIIIGIILNKHFIEIKKVAVIVN